MGCDGWAIDRSQVIAVVVYCYSCSGRIHLDDSNWVRHHSECADSTGRIPLAIAVENFEGR